MLIRNIQTQKLILGLSAFAFLSLTLMVLLHNSWISLLDTVTVQLAPTMLPKFLSTVLNIFYSFSVGPFAFIVIFLFVFFLWGFKFKIPAAWVAITSIGGFIILNVVNLIIPHYVSGIHTKYPAHAAFWITLFYSFWVIFVQPELSVLRKSWFYGLEALWLVAWIGTMLFSLFQVNITFSDVIAGWFLALIVLEGSEMLYVKYAETASRMPFFQNSWY